MISFTPLNVLLIIGAAIFIAVVFIYNIKKELK